MQLTTGQVEACKKLHEWMGNLSEYDLFKIHGYSGTGKTTIISHYMKQNAMDPKRIIFVAPTNKAKNVLKAKLANNGLHMYKLSTIFSLLYTWIDNPEYVAACAQAKELYDKRKISELSPDETIAFKKLCQAIKVMECNILVPGDKPEDLDLIIIDEASMVGRADAEILMSWGIPIIAIGDPFQLPPIKESNSLFMGYDPDVLLTEVCRQEPDNKILKLGTDLRNGVMMHPSLNRGYEKESLTIKKERDISRLVGANCVITYTNKMVAQVNQLIHNENYPENKEINLPQQGEVLMFYMGNFKREDSKDSQGNQEYVDRYTDSGEIYHEKKTYRKTLFDNGERVTFNQFVGSHMEMLKEDGSTMLFSKWDTYAFHSFIDGLQSVDTRELNRWYFTYGYACTVHKSQGSEFDHVYIVNDYPMHRRSSVEYRRWLYTAITRAKKTVYIEGGV